VYDQRLDIIYQLQGIEFEWDAEKARSNIANHGVTFEEAAEVFFDPFDQGDAVSTEEEVREFILGDSLAQWLLLVVYIGRGNGHGSLLRVRRRALRESAMKKPEEEHRLSVRPRETAVVSIAIPKDTLASLRQVAAQREMSDEALLKFYIGQGLPREKLCAPPDDLIPPTRVCDTRFGGAGRRDRRGREPGGLDGRTGRPELNALGSLTHGDGLHERQQP
jgi:uncharacterized DUF497 family protein